ncbi:bifunctional (p)ppGpp synthetase/guanosine-3',5'-bis(diphosphate) 3'-pyrophosphohydrolase, partial [candidate division FCPU426 bacterium]|nr:bifunctional (p)ppGpp synthetase/guanosine-3',5'-bis(diphosphate) 3'-pyrophosphohydrolase [candidate division FCPU426 bacterium]
PGDAIIGYITQGRGVSIHRADCMNAKILPAENGRRVAVTWDDMQAEPIHVSKLFVQAHDRERLRSDLLQVIDDAGALVKETQTRTNKRNIFEGTFTLQIKGKEHLSNLVKGLERVKGVMKVDRR